MGWGGPGFAQWSFPLPLTKVMLCTNALVLSKGPFDQTKHHALYQAPRTTSAARVWFDIPRMNGIAPRINSKRVPD